jgi:predicted RNA binding protein YcfA (HicA-like mRNA interferase family)
MSKKEKLLKRFLNVPGDLTWSELISVLKHLGYQQLSNGMTGGSRRRFVNVDGKAIFIHEPHPSRIIKKYIIRLIIEQCKEEIKKHG